MLFLFALLLSVFQAHCVVLFSLSLWSPQSKASWVISLFVFLLSTELVVLADVMWLEGYKSQFYTTPLVLLVARRKTGPWRTAALTAQFWDSSAGWLRVCEGEVCLGKLCPRCSPMPSQTVSSISWQAVPVIWDPRSAFSFRREGLWDSGKYIGM